MGLSRPHNGQGQLGSGYNRLQYRGLTLLTPLGQSWVSRPLERKLWEFNSPPPSTQVLHLLKGGGARGDQMMIFTTRVIARGPPAASIGRRGEKGSVVVWSRRSWWGWSARCGVHRHSALHDDPPQCPPRPSTLPPPPLSPLSRRIVDGPGLCDQLLGYRTGSKKGWGLKSDRLILDPLDQRLSACPAYYFL